MAIPKRLKSIEEVKARRIIEEHSEGYWDGMYMNSDFIYEGRNGRAEMIRVVRVWGRCLFEQGVVAN